MDCGEKIAFLRKRDSMTQAELGEALNVTYQAVSKWERGESHPDFDTISKIAKLFKVPISAFEDGVEISPIAVSTEAAATAEPAQERQTVGMCTQCGLIVYKGDEHCTEPKLICKSCAERIQRAAVLKRQQEETARKRAEQAAQDKIRWEKEKLKKRRNRGLWISAIPAGIILIVMTVLSLLPQNEDEFEFIFVGGLLLTLFTYCFVAQMIWDGTVREVCTAGGHVMSLPGVIFSLTPDGILWLILTKIFLAIVAAIVFVFTLLFCVLAAFLMSPFSFVPSLLWHNHEIAKVK